MNQLSRLLVCSLLLSGLISCAGHLRGTSTSRDVTGLPKLAMIPSSTATDAGSPSTLHGPTAPVTIEGVTLIDGAVAEGMKELEPQGYNTIFKNDVGRVYLYSRVSFDPASSGAIKHVWYFQDKPVASVKLTGQGSSFRTYSSKMIPPSYRGTWRVDVITVENKLLQSYSFQVE